MCLARETDDAHRNELKRALHQLKEHAKAGDLSYDEADRLASEFTNAQVLEYYIVKDRIELALGAAAERRDSATKA